MVHDAAGMREQHIDRLCELAAHVHAAVGELAVLAAGVDAEEAWAGAGYRSCAHWLGVNIGLADHSAVELLRVGHALRDLPHLRAAASAGRLSLDKLRTVTRVASAADEEVWLEVALHASGSQLARICRAYVRAGDDHADASARRARRGLWARWTDEGMLELRGTLAAEDGAVVLAALDVVAQRDAAERAASAGTEQDAADDPHAAGRADALVAVCEGVVAEASASTNGSAHRVVVHVNADTLLSGGRHGRCHVEDGAGLPASVVRRLGCDTELVAVVERDGEPLGVGRTRRVVSGRLRHALQLRDRCCRFPGCAVPAGRTHCHHVVHWVDGGPTDLDNLISLCGFHHRRLHDGVFDVVRMRDGEFRFTTSSGATIAAPDSPALVGAPGGAGLRALLQSTEEIAASNPFARDAGRRLDLAYAVEVLHDACARRRRLSGAGPP